MRFIYIIVSIMLLASLAFATVASANEVELTKLDHGRLKWVAIKIETGTSLTWQNPTTKTFFMATPKAASADHNSREISVSMLGENGASNEMHVRVYRDQNRKLQVERID